jgi:hypothetical protein
MKYNHVTKDSDGEDKPSVVSSDNSDSGDCLVVVAGCASSNDAWIVHSACSFHICCNKD